MTRRVVGLTPPGVIAGSGFQTEARIAAGAGDALAQFGKAMQDSSFAVAKLNERRKALEADDARATMRRRIMEDSLNVKTAQDFQNYVDENWGLYQEQVAPEIWEMIETDVRQVADQAWYGKATQEWSEQQKLLAAQANDDVASVGFEVSKAVRANGGMLFNPDNPEGNDAVMRAQALFDERVQSHVAAGNIAPSQALALADGQRLANAMAGLSHQMEGRSDIQNADLLVALRSGDVPPGMEVLFEGLDQADVLEMSKQASTLYTAISNSRTEREKASRKVMAEQYGVLAGTLLALSSGMQEESYPGQLEAVTAQLDALKMRHPEYADTITQTQLRANGIEQEQSNAEFTISSLGEVDFSETNRIISELAAAGVTDKVIVARRLTEHFNGLAQEAKAEQAFLDRNGLVLSVINGSATVDSVSNTKELRERADDVMPLDYSDSQALQTVSALAARGLVHQSFVRMIGEGINSAQGLERSHGLFMSVVGNPLDPRSLSSPAARSLQEAMGEERYARMVSALRYGMINNWDNASIWLRETTAVGLQSRTGERFTEQWKDAPAFRSDVESAFRSADGGWFGSVPVPDFLHGFVEDQTKQLMARGSDPEVALMTAVTAVSRQFGPSRLAVPHDIAAFKDGQAVSLFPPEKLFKLDSESGSDAASWMVPRINQFLNETRPTDSQGNPIVWSTGRDLPQISDTGEGQVGAAQNVWLQYAGQNAQGKPIYSFSYYDGATWQLLEADGGGVLYFDPSPQYERLRRAEEEANRNRVLNQKPKPNLSDMPTVIAP